MSMSPKNLTEAELKAFSVVVERNLRLEQKKIPLEYGNQHILDAIATTPVIF